MDDTFKLLGPKLKMICEFLYDKKYVITPTDKNLGIVVSEQTWILENTQECLSNQQEYMKLDDMTAQLILDEQCNTMLLLSQHAEIFDWRYGSVSKFLSSKVTLPRTDHHILCFYGILKIHKLPVKFQPISPCHSMIQNPAAKFCLKRLKPLVEGALTIIHDTKDLAIKSSKLQLQPGQKFYIITGDVMAYYPSIPLWKCLDHVVDMYSEWFLNNEKERWYIKDFSAKETELMGIADLSDLANLYG